MDGYAQSLNRKLRDERLSREMAYTLAWAKVLNARRRGG